VHKLAERLLKTIRKHELFRAGDRVAAAVSGGADSVALLCLLLELRADLGIVLSVAHVNHKLRGEESDADQRFVAELARQHGLEFHTCDAPAEGSGVAGIEARARDLRYSFFRRLAGKGRSPGGRLSGDEQSGSQLSRGELSWSELSWSEPGKTATRIATAHTLDDQAETVLLRIFRGTGIRGLSGIHPRIVFQEQGRVFGEVVRPLLGLRRAALLEFLRERGQGWREDSSNRDVAFLRNRVRHRFLPVITDEFGDAAIEHMAALAEIARAEEEHWVQAHPEIVPAVDATAKQATPDAGFGVRTETRQAASLPVEPLVALPLAAQRRLLRAWLETNAPTIKISFRLIEQALELARESAGKKIGMPSSWNLRRTQNDLLVEFEPSNKGEQATNYEYSLAVPGVVEIPELGARIEARIVDTVSVPGDERGQLLNPARMPKEVKIRNWRAGDRYWPAHTSAEKKVKELLSDRHATGTQKKLWPVAFAEGCGLIWMQSFAVPEAFRVPAEASQAIWIREIPSMM
jgi:tRNA(Ile)-lysidine synthase